MDIKVSRAKLMMLFLGMIVPIIACVVLSKSLVIGFLIAVFLNVNILMSCGFEFRELLSMIGASILECRTICTLILLIGATVSIWLGSGVVPTLIYYGSDLLKDTNFVLMAFIIVMICSSFIGSAVATISTIGIAIIGIGVSFDIPVHILLGVIVSGAFIADKISPISGLLNLVIDGADSTYKESAKNMMRTLIPTVIITSIIYYIIGLDYMGTRDISEVLKLQEMIKGSFLVSPILMFIPVAVVILSLRGLGALRSISIGCVIGIITSFFYQNASLGQIGNWIIFGYKSTSSYEYINNLLFSGGVISMIEVIFIVMGAVSVGGLFEKTGILKSALNDFINKNITKNTLILKTAFISILLTALTCDQVMGIVIPNKLFKDKFEKIGIKREVLVRTISDTGTIVAPLMPWNVNAIIIASVTGITSGYALFSVLCFLFPFVSIIVAMIENSFLKSDEVERCL